METSGGIVAGLSGRYATALFDLACEANAVDAVSASLATLNSALADIEIQLMSATMTHDP